MPIPSQITFQGLSRKPEFEELVLDRLAWLEKYYQGIVSCRVVLEVPHRHRRSGRHFHVAIELTVPGGEAIVINHNPSLHGPLKDTAAAEHLKDSETDGAHQHPRVAIHEAFDIARRRLQDFARRQRRAVKTHEPPAHGVVAALWPADGHGQIEANGGRIYFHRSSVLDAAFDELTIGTPVAFVEEKGEKGPQASTVRVLGKHHYASG